MSERVTLPTILGEMPGVYDPSSYATAAGCPRRYGLTAKFVNLDDTYLWIALYKRGEEVWRCNPTFFSAWFMPVRVYAPEDEVTP